MLLFVLFLALTVQQLGQCESPSHCHAPTKIKVADVVRFINRSPKSTWKASTYGYKEIDAKEFAKTKLGVKMDSLPVMSAAEMRKAKKNGQQSNGSSTGLPENFSWANTSRTKCKIAFIRDQSNCGSCWAVATASALSDRFCIASNGTFQTPLSHEKILSCCQNNYGCDGGYMTNVYQYMMENGTVTGGEYESDEGCQMYSIRPCGYFLHSMPCSSGTAYTPKCIKSRCNNDWYKYKEEKKTYKIASWKGYYAYYNEEPAKQNIYDNGPMVATFWVYPDFLLYQNGIYIHKTGWFPLGGHAVKIVGWGVENGVKYWHVANSWGKHWGENGHFRIRRGSNECGIDYFVVAMEPNMTSTSNDF